MNHLRKPVQVNQVPQGNTTAKDINRPQIECWVPRCSSNLEHFPTKTFYSLPKDPVLRDLWLAATGKKYHLPLQNIWFCENHFDMNKETKEASFPVCKMPQKICRTCLAPIHDKKYCILSSNIKSKMPESVEQIFGCATSVPLIDILQFCVPEMPIEMNPIPVSCDSCYRNIWIYYLFKNKCIYKEKAIEEEFYPGKYGNLVGCRACPSTDHTNLILLSENSELGILLSSMFSNLYSPSILPLKVCPACISALKGIQEFRKVLSRAQDYFKRHYKNPPQNEAIQDKPTVVAVNAKDTAQKQLLLGKLMLEKGLGLKDKCVSETHQAIIWNSIQKGFMLYGCHYSIQNLKDTWSMIILEYTLGRLKGTELGDILSQYMRAESPKVASKPLKKRYRTPSMDSGFDSSTTQAAAQNVTVEQNITPYRINPEPIGIFEPNIIPPPSCSATTSVPPPYPAPPPYAMSNADESDASTVTCSPVVEPDTPVSITAENSVPAQGYQASYNEFLFNIGTAKLDRKNKQASTERVASNIAENSKLKQPFESSMQNKCPQASYMSTSASSLSKTESAKETDNQSSLNSVIHSGKGQGISLMPKATTSFYSSGTTALGIKAVTSQRSNTGSVVLDRDKSDASKYPFKVEQNVGNSCVASSTISVIKSAIPSAVIDLTEDEDNMVQVANISSSWEAQSPEDTAGNEVSQVPNNIEIIETSTDNATSAAEVGRPIDTLATRGVVIEGDQIDKVGVASEASSSKARKTNDTCPDAQTATKNNIFDRVDIEQKIKTTEISRLCWTREEDMKFLDALIVEFGRVKERPMKDIWANLGSEAAFSSKTATNLAAHWCDLMKTYTKSSLDQELHEKMSHCMELWKQYIGNSSNASKRPDSDDKDMVLVKNMMHFLDDCDVFDEDWTVVLRKMSAYEEFAGYSYLDLKMHWKSLYHRFKFGMEALNLRADVKMEFSSLLVLMKKLKIRKFWDPWIVTNKRVSGRDSPFVPKKKRKKKFKRIVKSHQSFSFQDKVHLIDAIRCEYEVSRNKGVVSANPWRSIISKLHQVMYDNWDENRLWRMWSQMRLSAKIHAKDGSDYVDTEVWNLLERHNNYLKNRKKQQQNLGSSLSCPPEKNSDKQCNLEEKLDKQDDTLPVACASIDSPSKKVQTLISSYCTVEKSDKRVDSPMRVQSSSTCASVDEHSDLKPSDAKESVKLDEKPSQAKMDILTIEIDSDSDFSDGNNDSRDAAAKASLSPNVKTWTESEKNIFFKSVKIEFGKMLKNNEKISNPWKTIIKKLNRSQYSMYTFKELDKVWRKIRMDAHLHENNNAMFVTPLDTEVNRLIKLFHTIKEAKRTSKLTNAKSAEKPETKHDSDPKDAGKSKPAAPEKRKRKKRPLTLTKVKKDKKPKLALPPLDPNRLEEDKEAAEKTPWSEKELNDLISIIESTGNEVFKPDVPKQFWNNVRTKLIENGHSERSVGALYYKWNRLLESAKMAWADQKAPNKFDEVVIKFLAGVIRRNEKKPYCPEKNEEMKDATKSNVPGEIIKDKQQSELHSVDQNKSGRAVICDTSSSTNKNNEKCTIKENKQENVGSEPEENEMEDDASESEDEYVSAADIMKM